MIIFIAARLRSAVGRPGRRGVLVFFFPGALVAYHKYTRSTDDVVRLVPIPRAEADERRQRQRSSTSVGGRETAVTAERAG